MAVTSKLLFNRKFAENVQTAQYTVPSATRTIVDKFTATNETSATVVLSVNFVQSGDSASAMNRIIYNRAIAAGECYQCPELIGQVLEPAGFISTLCDTASALTLSVSGREITG